jgi:hypothetical protein
MMLIKDAKALYLDENNLDVPINSNVFAIDATTIDLCLSTFYWATFRSTKGGIKLHTQLDLKTAIPEFILFSNASLHDVNVLDHIKFESNSFYVMDRGYVDYKRLYKVHSCGSYFVTRAKDNMNYRRVKSYPKNSYDGIIYDQSILLNGFYAAIKTSMFACAFKGKILLHGITECDHNHHVYYLCNGWVKGQHIHHDFQVDII